MLEVHNSFNVFMQTFNIMDISQVRVNNRILGFTQILENNTKSPNVKKKFDSLVLSTSDLWMVGRYHGIPRVYCFYFYLEPTVRKDNLMRTAFVTVMVIVFKSGTLKVTWSHLGWKSLLSKYEAHWQQHFERYPTDFYFTDRDQHAC